MKSQQQISDTWGIWLSFSSGNKADTSYGNNLIELHRLRTWADFAYTWTHSQLCQPFNYFANVNTGEYSKIQIKGEMKKVQSINFFKNGIEPTWEYGDNSRGGYFNFTIGKEVPFEKVSQIYELLVFMAVGNTLSICERLRGVRIVDTSAKKRHHCRFQLWMDYQDDDENLVMIKAHGEQLRDLIKSTDFVLTDMKFFNIGGKVQKFQKEIKSQSTIKA